MSGTTGTKRERTTKREKTTKRVETIGADEGAAGDYVVTDTHGHPTPIKAAIAIRVLPNGELNLITDAGRWYLFAPNTWNTVQPEQPEPGNDGG